MSICVSLQPSPWVGVCHVYLTHLSICVSLQPSPWVGVCHVYLCLPTAFSLGGGLSCLSNPPVYLCLPAAFSPVSGGANSHDGLSCLSISSLVNSSEGKTECDGHHQGQGFTVDSIIEGNNK
uniref:Uncharacterized protein n=1 Tax=Hucho hucho TaxID=62062 RepID=A0A4W5LIJ6_9TELE